MSVVIIGSGGDHSNITRIVAAAVTGQMTEQQQAQFESIRSQLAALADEVDPQ